MISYIDNIPLKDIVYHGTAKPFSFISLKEGKYYKDFGQGFYTAYKKEHSIKAAKRSMKILKKDESVVYTYKTDKQEFEQLVRKNKVKYFSEPSLEWIDFVLKSRATKGVWHNYDIVIGPTADDDMKLCFDFYYQGEYGPLNSRQAKETLIRNLEIENFGVQFYIATNEGLNVLDEKSRKTERIVL